VTGRGAVIGLFSLCGAIGILCVAKFGGIFSGLFGPVAPFVLVASANVVVLVLALLVLYLTRNQTQAEKSSGIAF
ncbi:MAG: hypothetical protein ACR2P6_00535, partial [Gammaproteobacteria bacterium]